MAARAFLRRLRRTVVILLRTSLRRPKRTPATVVDWLIFGGLVGWAAGDVATQGSWPGRPLGAVILGGLLASLLIRRTTEPKAAPRDHAAPELEATCVRYGERWAGTLDARIRYDRVAAETAAAGLYRAARLPPPELRIWCRSPRESLLARPLIVVLLKEARSSPSWQAAWTAAVETCRPVGSDPIWEDAVANIGRQLPGGVPGVVGSAERLELPLEPLRPIEPMPRLGHWIWEGISPAIQRATRFDEAVAYQLGQEHRTGSERAAAVSEGRRAGLLNLAVREFLCEMPPAWVAARRLLYACHDAVLLSGAMILMDPPTSIATNDALLPHAEDGPALTYPDGFAVWARDGIPLPRLLIESPHETTVAFIRAATSGNMRQLQRSIEIYGPDRYRSEGGATPELIDAEPNIEMRRTMIDAYGPSRYAAAKGTVIHADVDGLGQVRRLWSAPRPRDETLVYVEVVNSTPEADGSRHVYWLRVPPHVRTCQEAVAWTFGIQDAEYQPVVET